MIFLLYFFVHLLIGAYLECSQAHWGLGQD